MTASRMEQKLNLMRTCCDTSDGLAAMSCGCEDVKTILRNTVNLWKKKTLPRVLK